jgi:hypothetical protein
VNGFPLLEFDRRPLDPYNLAGFVLTWNTKLTLIQPIEKEQFLLNGYSIFRNSDVKRWRPIPKDDFLARAAVLHKLRPRKPAEVGIDSIRQALSSAGKAFPRVTIHTERVRRGVCYVPSVVDESARLDSPLRIAAGGVGRGGKLSPQRYYPHRFWRHVRTATSAAREEVICRMPPALPTSGIMPGRCLLFLRARG